MLEFRTLNANEIDCRIATISEKGLSLLLYKDARVDQNILDETVGAMNWQRHHSRENANCTVAIWDKEKQQWVEKEDTGKESFSEAEKGLASDSFKRACFNWGIGRELYSAPFIWITPQNANITEGRNGKLQCYDKFIVSDIEYDANKNIVALTITNTNKGKVVFSMGGNIKESQKDEEPQKVEDISLMKIAEVKVKSLASRLAADGIDEGVILKLYKVKTLADLTELQFRNINEHWEDIKKVK